MVACNIVLLPEDHAMDKLVEINQREIEDNEILLDKESCLPHITLAMGGIMERDIEKVKVMLSSLTSEFIPMELECVSRPEKNHWIELVRNEKLYLIHRVILGSAAIFFDNNIYKEMFFTSPGEEIRESTINYVKDFTDVSSRENYQPHITVQSGSNKLEGVESFNFKADKLAIFQLGNHCTCRRLL